MMQDKVCRQYVKPFYIEVKARTLPNEKSVIREIIGFTKGGS